MSLPFLIMPLGPSQALKINKGNFSILNEVAPGTSLVYLEFSRGKIATGPDSIPFTQPSFWVNLA